MKRRAFLSTGSAAAGGVLFGNEPVRSIGVPLQQEALPFEFDALEPHFDAETIRSHYEAIHAQYAMKLRETLRSVNLNVANLSTLLTSIKSVVEPPNTRSVLHLTRRTGPLGEDVQKAIRFYGGGHQCHTVFWRFLAPRGDGPTKPVGRVAEAITSEFGSIKAFRHAFTEAAMDHVGEGWAWLVYRPDKKLVIATTSGNDHPRMKDYLPADICGRPVLCLDLWDHAYERQYKADRSAYIDAWWKVVNYSFMSRAYDIVTSA